jgi:SynChlorMet cassette radical SAM/SPASM protein ScmE
MINRSELSAPISVFLNLTNRCNLRCLHCSASAGNSLQDELSTGEWLALIQRLSELKVFKVTVTGGEPLLRPDLVELLDALGQRRIVFTINTNATLVSDELAEKLAGFRLLKALGVSLDGSSAAVHDRLRGGQAFESATRGIESLLRHGLRVGISAVVTKLNYHDLGKMIDLARALGVGSIAFTSLHPVGRAAEHNGNLYLSPDERKMVGQQLAELKARHAGFVTGGLADWYQLLSRPPRRGNSPRQIHACSAGRDSCAIGPDGSVLACNSAPDYVCGNIREADLAEIWHHSPQMKAVRDLSDLTSEDVEGCRVCAYRYVCATGCRADLWASTRSWTGGPGAACWLAETNS